MIHNSKDKTKKFKWFQFYAMIFGIILFYLFGCNLFDEPDYKTYKPTPYNFIGMYNFVKVTVPVGGIDFPIGIEDDDTARVENAFYIGETMITLALWDTVARWAEKKEYGKYEIFTNDHHRYDDYWDNRDGYNRSNYPIWERFAEGWNDTYGYSREIGLSFVAPQWCNAFTEWHNEQYGTNFVPVYQDIHGNPVRFVNNWDNFIGSADPNASGFRLPTAEEWELAARWNGFSDVNVVTKTINGIDFSSQKIKFTTGNSASGARSNINNFNENDRVANWINNSGYDSNSLRKNVIISVKSKQPNYLGLYDMSGNVKELTSTHEISNISITGRITWRSIYKGGSYESDANSIAIGNSARYSFDTTYNAGFRIARNAE